jgi:hypothetical protein
MKTNNPLADLQEETIRREAIRLDREIQAYLQHPSHQQRTESQDDG